MRFTGIGHEFPFQICRRVFFQRLARRVNRGLEALVRECPEQYLWGYNRYKTPKGAKPQ